jgi:hypothetical protein
MSKGAEDELVKNVDELGDVLDLTGKYLMGYPYIVTTALEGEDIVLGDWTMFGVAARDLRNEADDGMAFDSAQMIVRTIIRACGRCLWSGAITLDDGTVVYPFVANDDVEAEPSAASSSSSSSVSSASSASSESSSGSSASSVSSLSSNGVTSHSSASSESSGL